MKTVCGVCIFSLFICFKSAAQITPKFPDDTETLANLTAHIDRLSTEISALTKAISSIDSVANQANEQIAKFIPMFGNATIVLENTADQIRNIASVIDTKFSQSYVGQIVAIVAGGGTGLGLGVYVLYRLAHKLAPNSETPATQADAGVPSIGTNPLRQTQ